MNRPVPSSSESCGSAAIEKRVHERVNDERAERGLETLEFDPKLAAVARSHSNDMAIREYVGHESPEGEDFGDRYADAGYDCCVAASGNRYLQGGENVAKTYYEALLADGSRPTSPREVAASIVDGWLDSSGHRENLLREVWTCEGVGVALADEDGTTAVYATQNFC